MKRSVFVIDDKLNDVAGILFSLQAILRKMLHDKPDALSHTNIVFCHICWDADKQTQQDNQAFFEQERGRALEYIKQLQMPAAETVIYLPIILDKKTYTTKKFSNMAKQILKKQKDVLKEFCEKKVWQQFPETDGDAFSYAVLLDIVLNLDVDRERIAQGSPGLSNELYSCFPAERRIVYTNYEDGTTESWMKIAGTSEQPIQRQFISRARGIYRPFKERVYRAFNINEAGGTQNGRV